MAEQESNKSTRLPTGMIKRANPLSLNPSEEKSQNRKQVSKTAKVQTVDEENISLSGEKKFFFILPFVNKALLTELKNVFPSISNQSLLDQALLHLLRTKRPNAYASLVKRIKK